MPRTGKTLHPFTGRVIACIKNVPRGRVASYGQIAALAGNHRAARQVARILHSLSRAYGLPWHRIISSRGMISLKPGYGYEEQKRKLVAEGIRFDMQDRINLYEQGWNHTER